MWDNNGIRINFVVGVTVVFIVYTALIRNVSFVAAAPTTTSFPINETLYDECRYTLKKHSGMLDYKFWKKFFKHWVPFRSREQVKMQFILYKKDFPECGRPIDPENDDTLAESGFDAKHQTRIIIHGWLSQSKGSLGRDVKNAYLSLTSPSSNEPNSSSTHADHDAPEDFNVIVVDWSVISTNVNYFAVVDRIDDLAFLLSEFIRYLQVRTGLHLDDVYLIGHSLGAQIAGSAGKQMKPFVFNTIFALDPAGPQFRDRAEDFRIDAGDAKYVESILTSESLGFNEPVGHATFYPNFGHDQKNCRKYGCSHSRAHDYFAESISSKKGFWGVPCKRETKAIWVISDPNTEVKMGGEPSTPKQGTFLVRTHDRPPYAMGRQLPTAQTEAESKTETVMS